MSYIKGRTFQSIPQTSWKGILEGVIGEPVEVKKQITEPIPYLGPESGDRKDFKESRFSKNRTKIFSEDVRMDWSYPQVDLILCQLELNLPMSDRNPEIKEISFSYVNET